jgi:GTP-binding protein
MDPAPTIAIVGRPNVGKSSLFNRLIGKKQAIIAKEAGTTRDRIAQHWDCNGYDTLLVDTGGLEYGKQTDIEADIQSQATLAIEEADVIVFVIDTIQELTVDDFTAANILRKSKKPIIMVANKCDSPSIENKVFNIYELGFGDPVAVSAIHKTGVEELKDRIEDELKKLKVKKNKKKTEKKEGIHLCILGKPNAGKSTLVNSLLGQEKVIVSDVPGTTRDATDTEIEYNKQKFVLTDTAGLRRKGKIERGIEKFSSFRVLSSIESSDIAVLLIDGKKGITSQDTHIAEFIMEARKGMIIVINKIDLFEDKENEKNRTISQLRRRFAFAGWAPVVFISAKNKKNTYQILEIAQEIYEERRKRIETPKLNTFLQRITYKHVPSGRGIKKPKFFYGSQVDINPPKFVLFFRNPQNLHFSYPRYIENELRKEFGFNGTAMELKFKTKV